MSHKPYVCSMCQKPFSAQFSLQKHIEFRHSSGKEKNEKNTVLNQRNEQTNQNKDDAQKPTQLYSCKFCDKTFEKSKNLQEHALSSGHFIKLDG